MNRNIYFLEQSFFMTQFSLFAFVTWTVLVSTLISCRQSALSSEDSDVLQVARTECEKNIPQLSTGRQITTAYHWTNNEGALKNPTKYINDLIQTSLKDNEGDLSEGVAGAGLYLASDPFVSTRFGNILLTIPLKPNQKVALYERSNGPSLEEIYNTNGCRAIAYRWESIYDSKIALALTNSDFILLNSPDLTAQKIDLKNSEKYKDYRTPYPKNFPQDQFIVKANGNSFLTTLLSIGFRTSTQEPTKAATKLALQTIIQKRTEDKKGDRSVYQLIKADPSFLEFIKGEGFPSSDQAVDNYLLNRFLFTQNGEIEILGKKFIITLDLLAQYFSAAELNVAGVGSFNALWEKVTASVKESVDGKYIFSIKDYVLEFKSKNQATSIGAWK